MLKYVLTGATGGLGSEVFKHLLKVVPASDIIVSLYNPAGQPPQSKNPGDPHSLDKAFAGADKLLLVSYPSIAHEIRVQHHKHAIDAAKRVGVKHVYYTSLAFAADSVAVVMQAHIDTEAYLKASGLTYTILREGIYGENFPMWIGFWDPAEKNDNLVILYGQGGVGWVCREDLGEGTAKVMVKGGFEGETHLLSGSRSVTLTEIAAKVSALLGRKLKLNIVSEDEYVKANTGKPGPQGDEGFLRSWATTYKALVRGELNVTNSFLQEILGREPKSLDDILKEGLGLVGHAKEMLTQYVAQSCIQDSYRAYYAFYQ